MNPGIATGIVSAVSGALRELGFPGPADAADPDVLLDAAARELGDDALGLTLARKLPIGSLGLIDYALCSSETLRAGVRRLVRHFAVVSGRVHLTFVETTPSARVVMVRKPGIAYSRHWIEFSFAILAERARQVIGAEARLERVRFAHGPPPRRDRHDAFFAAPVEFGAPEDAAQVPAHLLDVPLRTAAPALGDVLEARIRELGPAMQPEIPLLARVRDAVLRQLADGSISLDALAAELGVARRSLQRQLRSHGTSHQALVDSLRRERALALLKSQRLSVGEISEQLGFSEPSAFFRAFRRWTGSSPRAAARKL